MENCTTKKSSFISETGYFYFKKITQSTGGKQEPAITLFKFSSQQFFFSIEINQDNNFTSRIT